MAAIFYFLTAFTAIWYYRKVITKSAGNLILGGIMPGVRRGVHGLRHRLLAGDRIS